MDEDQGITDSLARLPSRLAGIVDLIGSLDQRLIATLDAIDRMSSSVTAIDPVREDIAEMVAEIRDRAAELDARLNADLDEMKALVRAKLEGLDLTGFGSRFDRMEAAVLNIERATVNLDRAFEGGLELLPDFLTKRMKGQGS